MYKTLISKSLLAVILVTSLFFSCSEESKMLDDALFGYEYFPVDTNKYWVYAIDRTIIDDNGATIINETEFVREAITETFVNGAGDSIYRIERSISDTQAGPYAITDIWTAERTLSAAFRTEENLEFVKMVYPINVGAQWEGNNFDELIDINVADESVKVYKDWGDYECTAKGISLIVNGVEYLDVLTVVQGDFSSDIERRYAVEHYAPGVGLIKKEMIILDTQCVCAGETWLEKAERGFTLSQNLVEHN